MASVGVNILFDRIATVWWRFCIIVWIIVGIASAAPPPLVITTNGHYLLKMSVDGTPTFTAIEKIIDLRVKSDPDDPGRPEDPQEPDDPELKPPPAGISLDASQWAEEIGDMPGAQKYALIFEIVRDGLRDEKIAPGKVYGILRKSADALIGPEWSGFREKTGEYFNSRLQAGGMTTVEQVSNEMDLIRYGIGYAARNSPSIPPFESVEVLSIVLGFIKESGL